MLQHCSPAQPLSLASKDELVGGLGRLELPMYHLLNMLPRSSPLLLHSRWTASHLSPSLPCSWSAQMRSNLALHASALSGRRLCFCIIAQWVPTKFLTFCEILVRLHRVAFFLFCKYVYVLRVRPGVNLTGRRNTNACGPVENQTGNKKKPDSSTFEKHCPSDHNRLAREHKEKTGSPTF